MVEGYRCGSCDTWHSDLPFSYHSDAPEYWDDEAERSPDSELSSDQCIIGNEYFFVRGLVTLPVLNHAEHFEWGVWVSVSEESFDEMCDQWTVEGRENSPPAFGWLSTDLPLYDPGTLNLKSMVHTQPVGQRPLINLEPTGHPLAVQQRDGVTIDWIRSLASQLQYG